MRALGLLPELPARQQWVIIFGTSLVLVSASVLVPVLVPVPVLVTVPVPVLVLVPVHGQALYL